MNRIEGKSAIITGGTRGIGLAIAMALAERKARVFVCSRERLSVDAARVRIREKSEVHVSGAACDVRDHSQVQAMIQAAERELDGIDILINNAGVGVFRSVEEMAEPEWRAVLETNLSGVFHCCHEAIPAMKRRGGGYIINIGSLAGRNAFAGGAAYNASKFGLIGFSEALMQEVRYEDIRVSCVMPGSVETEFAGSNVQSGSSAWKLWPEDVAAIVVDLLQMDPRALASSVELRPSKPKK